MFMEWAYISFFNSGFELAHLNTNLKYGLKVKAQLYLEKSQKVPRVVSESCAAKSLTFSYQECVDLVVHRKNSQTPAY